MRPLAARQDPEPGETFAACAEAWLDGYVYSLKHRTQENYRQVLRRTWIPALGAHELAELSREDIRQVVARQMRRLSISTVRTNLDVLHACLTAAVDEGQIPPPPPRATAAPSCACRPSAAGVCRCSGRTSCSSC